jgi:hypothetical protein
MTSIDLSAHEEATLMTEEARELEFFALLLQVLGDELAGLLAKMQAGIAKLEAAVVSATR